MAEIWKSDFSFLDPAHACSKWSTLS